MAWQLPQVPVGGGGGGDGGGGGGGATAAPVPAAVSRSVGRAGSFVARFQQALAAPSAVGAKRTVSVWVTPATTLNAAVGVTVNAAGLLPSQGVTPLTLSVAEPVLPTTAVRVELWPTVTLPNASEAGVSVALGTGTAVPAPATETVSVGCAASFVASRKQP